MFRIRQLTPDAIPANRRLIDEAKGIMRERLPGVSEREFDTFEQRLRDPLSFRFHAMLFVADNMRGKMLGFAYLSHAPDLGFCFLDYIAIPALSGGGVGGALYQRLREVSRNLGAIGLFFECLPEDPAACSRPENARDNAARLRFYERLGAKIVVNTDYEQPMTPGMLDMSHLLFDDLGSNQPLSRDRAREIVRAITERKYGDLCDEHYVSSLLQSIVDDPVRLRESSLRAKEQAPTKPTAEGLIALVVNDRHDIHHVRDRGYVEAPARVASILKGIEPTGLFYHIKPRHISESVLTTVHDPSFVRYLKQACGEVPEGRSVYPQVFPVRNRARPPKDRAYAAGYYCIDTFTPINASAWKAAVRAVECVMTATDAVLEGQRFAYALVRPPGHHAEHSVFGGFCYFCNAALAAHRMSEFGKVVILDLDYHHGNGQQNIFYQRADVLTVSIHGHPSFAYPFFAGFEDELGEGEGEGYNLNIALPESIEPSRYRAALSTAMERIEIFNPDFLVVAIGFDTGRGDPTGTWPLRPVDFRENGRIIASIDLPTLVVQEGGYRTATLGDNARGFFEGLAGSH